MRRIALTALASILTLSASAASAQPNIIAVGSTEQLTVRTPEDFNTLRAKCPDPECKRVISRWSDSQALLLVSFDEKPHRDYWFSQIRTSQKKLSASWPQVLR
jgi:hypothetical protein